MEYNKPSPLTVWIVWIALFESVFLYQFLIGEENPESQLSFMVLSLLCTLQYTPVFAGNFGVEQVDEGNGR